MHKLIYSAIIPCLINSAIAVNPDQESANHQSSLISTNLKSQEDSDDASSEQSDSDLEQLIAWRENRTQTETDDQNPNTLKHQDHDLFMSCVGMLSPYMKKHRSTYTNEENDNLQNILVHIGQSLNAMIPTERYQMAQQLNILAMFESEITFANKKGEITTFTLADKFRKGKNHYNPMKDMSTQIEIGTLTAVEASLKLFDEWAEKGTLNGMVKSCKRRLRNSGFHQYQWLDIEIVDLLTYRASNPHQAKKLMYDDAKIKKFCKRISKKGRSKNEYTQNIALLIATQWRHQGVLNEAIEDCRQYLEEAQKVYVFHG